MKNVLFGFIFVIFVLTMFKMSTARPQELDEVVLQLDNTHQSQKREIYIDGVISELTPVTVRNQLNKLNGEGNGEITIHITSPGGSVYYGLQIYDYMMQSKAPIRTSCEGYCMSMAAFLLMAGDVRESGESATIMFHTLSSESKGHLQDMAADMAESNRLQDMMDIRIHDHTGLSLDAIRKMESYDHFMSSQDAKELHIIDQIVGKHGAK